MNTAQEHALEQANLIAQLVKYADRLIVVESASPQERHDFVELVAERLPDSIETLAITAQPGNLPLEVISLVTEALQLSPGIESPRQLASAVHEALSAQGRMLVIIENANAWLETESWPELLLMLRAAHELAPNHLLFLLTGEIDLTEHLRTEPELADMQGDMHQCLLLDAAFANTAPETAPHATQKQPPHKDPKEEALVASLQDSEGRSTQQPGKTSRRPFNPTLLIIAAFSVAIVSFGGFALLTRTADKGPSSKNLPLEQTTPSATTSQPPLETAAATPVPQVGNPLPNDGEIGKTGAPETPLTAAAPASNHLEPVPAPQSATSGAAEPPATETPSTLAATKAPEITTSNTAASPTLETPAVEKPPQAKVIIKHTPAQEPRKHTPTRRLQPVEATKITGVDNAWYHARPKNHAALQLGAFTDTKAAIDFVRKHKTATNLTDWRIFSQRPKDQTLYTVTVGNFDSLTEARKVIAKLPEPLRQIKPYPRSFNAIDQVLTK
ncbi:MAG: SPOR domain-containing protein [Halothiobacillus sp.]|jgi:DamX protein|nr:SPOR domain-containing protein [Halothiobacillus sp.]